MTPNPAGALSETEREALEYVESVIDASPTGSRVLLVCAALRRLTADGVHASHAPQVGVTEEAEFEGWQDGTPVFGCSGPREEAEREARHYLSQYEQDGPVTIYEVTRREWTP